MVPTFAAMARGRKASAGALGKNFYATLLFIRLQIGKRMAVTAFTTWQVRDDAGRRKYLSQDERLRFLREADRLDASERALCHTLALSGCRISEALSLCRHQLDTDSVSLIFRTLKRRRLVYRVVPIPDYLVALLRDLPLGEGERFWIAHRATAWRAVKRTMIAAGVAGPMACCKGLRHGFGMYAATCNIPPNLIQRWMGHTSPTTTAVYVDAVGVEEREFVRRMW